MTEAASSPKQAPHLHVIGASSKIAIVPYGFEDKFRNAVAALCCSNPGFFERIGNDLNPELMGTESTRLAVMASQRIHKLTGGSPSSVITVLQQARTMVDEGLCSDDDVLALNECVQDAIDAGLPSAEEALILVASEVRDRLEQEAARVASFEYGKRSDIRNLNKVTELLARAKNVGKRRPRSGDLLGSTSFKRIDEMAQIKRLPFGWMGVDEPLKGGVAKGTASTVVSSSGDGKSMVCIGRAGHASRLGVYSIYISLELPHAETEARLIAWLTGETIDNINAGGDHRKAAEAILEALKPYRAPIWVEEMTPTATRWEHVLDLISKVEDAWGHRVEQLILDPAYKLGTDDVTKLYEDIRMLAYQEQRVDWILTPDQLKNRNSRKHADLHGDDTAGKTDKQREIDFSMMLAKKKDNEFAAFVNKNRQGKKDFYTPNFVPDFERARMFPTSWNLRDAAREDVLGIRS